MTTGPTDKGDDGSVDVEAAWADIVAHWDDPATERPVRDRSSDADADGDEAAAAAGTSGDDATSPDAGAPADGKDPVADRPSDGNPHGGDPGGADPGGADPGSGDGWDADAWDRPRSRVGGEQARLSAAREAELEALEDDRYHPPEPPPLPRGDLVSRLAWAGVLGAPVFFLVAALFWRSAPVVLVVGAVLAFIAGFATLVVRMPDRDEDDPDDGAVV